jgi:hypothetical protein
MHLKGAVESKKISIVDRSIRFKIYTITTLKTCTGKHMLFRNIGARAATQKNSFGSEIPVIMVRCHVKLTSYQKRGLKVKNLVFHKKLSCAIVWSGARHKDN